jgi:predicted dehydrogenase
MTDDLGIGIVGFGGMGQGHARNVSQIEGMRLIAVSDPSPESQKKAVEQGAKAFDDYRKMIGDSSPDAIVVASPSNTHGEVVKHCCEIGLPVFTEKPFTTSLSEALEVRDAVVSSGTKFAIGLVLRHSKMYQGAKDLIEEGRIGKVGMADCRYSGHMLGRYHYVFSKELGRGLINEHTIHMIDIMEYILGPVSRVYAETDACPEHTEYNASILMTHEGGAFTSISGSGVSRQPGFARITGIDGEIFIEGNRRLVLKDEVEETEILLADLGYKRELEDFRDVVTTGKTPHTGIEAAVSSARLIEAIYLSAERGEIIHPGDLA